METERSRKWNVRNFPGEFEGEVKVDGEGDKIDVFLRRQHLRDVAWKESEWCRGSIGTNIVFYVVNNDLHLVLN